MWSDAEVLSVRRILDDLRCYKRTGQQSLHTTCVFTPSDAHRLGDNLRDGLSCLMIRRVIEHLAENENLPFRWMLDHKLILNLILHEFLPALTPLTIGLARAYLDAGSVPLADYLDTLFPSGYVVKSCRGAGSKRQDVLQSAATTLPMISREDVLNAYTGKPESELFLVQAKIVTKREYRIHTIGRSIIPTLTRRTFGPRNEAISVVERMDIEQFTRQAFRFLPDGLCSDLVCGWDIGVDYYYQFHIFEINFSGNHPVFRPGFQCSNYFQSRDQGPLNIAGLLHFVSEMYNVRFEFELTSPVGELETKMFEQIYRVSRWTRLFQVADEVFDLWKDSDTCALVGDTSLQSLIRENRAGNLDRKYVNCLEVLMKITEELR
jgi:hypothetical protein